MAQMADMEEIEGAMGEDDALVTGTAECCQIATKCVNGGDLLRFGLGSMAQNSSTI